ncbi:MAG: malto-oligosyltrehalose trehalohydrolase [Chloroflexi bacterium]|nr:malto-oligosyltrehalose trehalohydrolase [Chloroflexota bacterium]
MRGAPWHLDMGARPVAGGVRFRVWATAASRVEAELHGAAKRYVPMELGGDGAWEATVPGCGPGTRYKYRLNEQTSFPDPCSRSQPEGVHGPSEVLDPEAYSWHDRSWPGLDARGLVLYECHVGAATPEGTFDSLIGQLDRLRALGIGALQVMPVAEFPGRRNWGYDGVYPYAPTATYGGAAGLKRLVDAAHQRGLGVILDVVYNHLGPEGNYLRQFSPDYFTSRYQTPWGDAVNYDGPNSHWVRKYVIDNARYWVQEYHLDGLRLDAAFKIHDSSQPHVLQELTQAVRACLAPERPAVLVAETSENEVYYCLPTSSGGYGFDAAYADDFHHALRRYLTGDHEGYYQDYQGTLAEVARIINQGFLYEGEWSRFWGAARGTPARQQPPWQFLYCLENHDQVGNRALGDRLHHALDLDRYRVASALLLLVPYTPLLFMGQEFAASSPFQYFTDHGPELGRLIAAGRRQEFAAYAAFADPASAARIPDPQAESTFLGSRLKLDELARSPGVEVQRLYQELLRLRRDDPVLARQDRHAARAQALSADLLALHGWHGDEHRLLLANFGAAAEVRVSDFLGGGVPSGWRPLLDTNELRFGGRGALAAAQGGRVAVPARSAVLLATATSSRAGLRASGVS